MGLVLVGLIIPTVGVFAGSGSGSSVAAWSTNYKVTTYQENSTSVDWNGHWTRVSYRNYSGGRVRSTDQRGAGATVTFKGTGFAWVGPVGPTRGEAKIYVDGEYVKTVNMYASRYVASTVVFQHLFSGYGTHTFKMVSLATNGHPTVAVDKFIIRGNNKVPVEQAEVPAPTPDATATPTAAPATDPTPSLSASPTAPPAPATPVPTAVATPVPTAAPTAAPTPTPKPTATPVPTAPPAPPTGGSFYGPGIAADGLANTQVGGTSCGCANLMSSYRFRAGQTADLSSIHIYIIGLGHPGYAAGNGGKMNISIQKDDGSSNHHPSGTALASTTVAGNALGAFPTIDFGSPASLTAGQLYHVVFRNTDPSPTVNFVSIDSLIVEPGLISPRQAKYSDVDWAQLLNSGSGWKLRPEYTPILQLEYDNGAVEGVGYMEAWVGDPKRIGGTSKVREVITVAGGSRTVDSVSVRVRRTGGSGALTVRLETAAGVLIDEGSVPATGSSLMTWQTVGFDSARTLSNGASYNLVLSAPAGTTFTTFAVRQGSSYGFTSSTYFTAGRMQYTTGSSWVNVEAWGNSSTEGDLQFYFH